MRLKLPSLVLALAALVPGTAFAGPVTVIDPGLGTAVPVPIVAAPKQSFDGSSIFSRGGVPKNRVPGRALLKLTGVDGLRLIQHRADDVEATHVLENLGKRHGATLRVVRSVMLGWVLVEIRDARDPTHMPNEEQTAALIAALDGDAAVQATTDQRWLRGTAAPNDPGLAQMWHFQAIGAQGAWDITQGLSTQRIGVVDTGLLRAHEDVGTRAVNGFDFITENGNDGSGRDANFDDAGDACPADGTADSFHGTHVAGTIGAKANNGLGVAGLNFNAGLVIARALGTCGGTLDDIMEGAAWLAGQSIDGVPPIGADKVSVMNLSLGIDDVACSKFEQDAINFIDSQGVIFVAAAGNNGGAVGSPGNCQNVVTVAAHGPNNDLASYSSFGTKIDIVAPGGDFSFGQAGGVLSSIGPGSSGYGFLQGTSMAAPHVTGSISLMQAVNASLTRAQVVALMQGNGGTCGGCQGKVRLQLDLALAATPAGGSGVVIPDPTQGLADDAFEENDTFAQASPAKCDADAILVARRRDIDFFRLQVGSSSDVEVRITALSGKDLDLKVTDDQSKILARSETTGGAEVIRGHTNGGVLGIAVVPFVDTGTGLENEDSYRLQIKCAPSTATIDKLFAEDATVDLATSSSPLTPGAAGLTPGEALQTNDNITVKGGCSATGTDASGLGFAALCVLAGLRRRRAL